MLTPLLLLIIKISCFHSVLLNDRQGSKVFRGIPAKEGEFPFVVSLQMYGESFCGGSLVSLSWILTACHCIGRFPKSGIFEHFNSSALLAVGGSVDISPDGVNQVRDIRSIISHPKCEKVVPGWEKDYGLLETWDQFKKGPTLNAMKIFSLKKSELQTKTNELLSNSFKCQIVGWGRPKLSPVGYSNDTYLLMKFDTYLSDPKKCKDDIFVKQSTKRSENEIDHVRGQFCAYGYAACQGDSGGPLSCDGDVYGLASWEPKCDGNKTPTIYSRLDYEIEFFSWIRQAGATSKCTIERNSLNLLSQLGIFLFFALQNRA